MDHTIDGFCVEWFCIICGEPNTDYFNWTAFPICSSCVESFDWADILSQSEIDELLAGLKDNE